MIEPGQLPLDAMAALLTAADESHAMQLLGEWQAAHLPAAKVHAAMLLARDVGLETSDVGVEGVLARFDRLQSRWVHMLEEFWLARINALELRLVEEGRAKLLQEAHIHWLEVGFVDIYNYHCEMPLLARVKVVTVREHGLSVTCDPDLALLIAAGEQRRTAYMQLPGTALRLRLVVEGTSGRSVHFREDGLMGIEREKRRHIRVRNKDATPIKLHHVKGPKWDAGIQDFSAYGLGIASHEELPWPIGKQVVCLFEAGDKPVDIEGVIRWKLTHDKMTRMGIELPVEHPYIHLLQLRLAERQREIMAELRRSGTPDCLRDVPSEARLI